MHTHRFPPDTETQNVYVCSGAVAESTFLPLASYALTPPRLPRPHLTPSP